MALLFMYLLFFTVQVCLKFCFAAQGSPYPLVIKNQYGEVLPIHTVYSPVKPYKLSSKLILDKRYQLPEDCTLPTCVSPIPVFYTIVRLYFPRSEAHLCNTSTIHSYLRGPPVLSA